MQLLERAAAKARARTQPGRAWALALGADCTYGAIAYDVEMQQVREQDVDAAHQPWMLANASLLSCASVQLLLTHAGSLLEAQLPTCVYAQVALLPWYISTVHT